MSKLEEIKLSFGDKLDQAQQQHDQQMQADLAHIRQQVIQQTRTRFPGGIKAQLPQIEATLQRQPQPSTYAKELGLAAPPRMDSASAALFQMLRQRFTQAFNLPAFFPARQVSEQVVFCFTLEQYLDAITRDYNLAAAERARLRQQMLEAPVSASWGVFLSGQGCYINGWLFEQAAYQAPAQQIFQQLWKFPAVIQTILHELLGHGFLSNFSSLGQAENKLERSKLQIVRDFHLQASQDPATHLQFEMFELLLRYSLITEEGWATWIAHLFSTLLFESPGSKSFTPHDLLGALIELPGVSEADQTLREMLVSLLVVLFDGEQHEKAVIHQAMLVFQSPERFIPGLNARALDDYIAQKCGMPLRYVLGNCLVNQAAANLGPLCVPYAALIALNIDLQPGKIGLLDLDYLMQKDPALNPDTRLAVLSKMKLGSQRNNIRQLAAQAEQQISFIAPAELKRM